MMLSPFMGAEINMAKRLAWVPEGVKMEASLPHISAIFYSREFVMGQSL